ncbi:MAG: aspartate kinase, partial [Muribaculaceae bacterium]|nr:aspartate kinase [Muribaculaceae bacterium]
MKVLKFGGTSVGSAKRIKEVAKLITGRGANIIVLSAMSGTTNTLVEIADYLYKRNVNGAKETINCLEKRYGEVMAELFADATALEAAKERIDAIFAHIRTFTHNDDFSEADEKEILAQGELMSTSLMHFYLHEQGFNSVWLPALDFMRTDHNGEADVDYITLKITPMLEANPDADLFVTQGFICRNHKGGTDNLQRGGSDLTASLIGAAINAEEIEIWTDIDGMHNNDPRFVDKTEPVAELHFDEAAELAYFGAKILHPTCVMPAKLNNIPIRVLNTMEPEARGTLIYNTVHSRSIKAVAAKDGVIAVKIRSSR